MVSTADTKRRRERKVKGGEGWVVWNFSNFRRVILCDPALVSPSLFS
jgi:hypothetical protein